MVTVHKKNDSVLIKRILEIRDLMLTKGSQEDTVKLWESWFVGKGVQEAYDWFRPKGEKRFWAKFVWHDAVPPKYSFITWLAIRGRLATRDRLAYMNLDLTCRLCEAALESAEHLFYRCPKTWEVWSKIMDWLEPEGALLPSRVL